MCLVILNAFLTCNLSTYFLVKLGFIRTSWASLLFLNIFYFPAVLPTKVVYGHTGVVRNNKIKLKNQNLVTALFGNTLAGFYYTLVNFCLIFLSNVTRFTDFFGCV